MLVETLITRVQTRLQEEDLDGLIILGWFDDAQSKIGKRIGARFPKFLNKDGTQSTIDEPVFDEDYHELLVTFACARYRESDEAIGEAQYLDGLFESELNECATNMLVPPQYQDDENSQQFVLVDGQSSVTITKPTFTRYYSYIQVFHNGIELFERQGYVINNNVITLLVSTIANDRISVLWEESQIYNNPPQLTGGAW